MRDGNQKHVVVLTPQPFVCPQARLQPAADPPGLSGISNFVATEERRYRIDQRQRKTCALLAKTGQAFVLQPKEPLHLSSMHADEKALRALYARGYEDTKAAYPKLLEFLTNESK